jgi:hypothetical protein
LCQQAAGTPVPPPAEKAKHTDPAPVWVVVDVTNPTNLEHMTASYQKHCGAANQALFLLVSNENFAAAFDLMKSWGYAYLKVLTIVADSRKKWVQHCIIGVKGQPQLTKFKIPDIIHEKSPEHHDELLRVANSTCRYNGGTLFLTGPSDWRWRRERLDDRLKNLPDPGPRPWVVA